MEFSEASAFFQSRFPPALETRTIGIENEYPLVYSSGEGIRYDIIAYLWNELAALGWELKQDSSTQRTVVAYQNGDGVGFRNMITTDAGFHTLEIGVTPTGSLQEGEETLKELLELVTTILAKRDVIVLGYGVQPIAPPRDENLAPRGRYRFLADDCNAGIIHTNSLDVHGIHQPGGIIVYPHDYSIFTLSAAAQTHVDVNWEEAVKAVNALNATAGLRVALMANSPLWRGQMTTNQANRELFWDWAWTNRHNQTSMPPHFLNLDHYLDYIFDFRCLMLQRESTYYQMDTRLPFRQFFLSGEGRTGLSPLGQQMMLYPTLEDINFQCGTAWWDARLQSAHGTVEDRCICNQPPQEHLAGAALTLGLVENLSELSEIAASLSVDHWREVRISACIHGMQAHYPGVDIVRLIQQMVDVARLGLEKRGLGEEAYLQPLYRRIAEQRSPADEVRERFNQGGVAALVQHCDMRNML
jgi:gamma-glutamylcysteine synthetase